MKINNQVTIPATYRSLRDVYKVLRGFSPLADISRAIGISPQGLRQKCNGPQFFTVKERQGALAVIEALISRLEGVRDAVTSLPTRLGPED